MTAPPSPRSVPAPSRPRRHTGRRSATAAGAAVALLVAAACDDTSENSEAALPPLLTEAQLGDGWAPSDPGEVELLPGSVAPPCPFDGEIPDIELAAADSIEFGDEARQLGINHTVVELSGDADGARAVLGTWEAMDCSDSDAEQRPVAGLPAGLFGVELDTVDSEFTQTVLVRVVGSALSFLVVTGYGEVVIDTTRDLAPLI